MSVAALDLTLFAVALGALALTPGPVVVAVIARAVTGGLGSAAALGLGVVLGDLVWAASALLGLAALAEAYGAAMEVLRYLGACILIWMGWRLWRRRQAAEAIAPDPSLLRRTWRQAFLAGLLVNLGNPKAIFFFMGVLPSFFAFGGLTVLDIGAILALSAAVPFLGILLWAVAASRARIFLSAPRIRRRVDQASGGALIGAGAAVAAA